MLTCEGYQQLVQQQQAQGTQRSTHSRAMANPLPTDGTVDVGPWLSEERCPAHQAAGLFISAEAAASVPLRHRWGIPSTYRGLWSCILSVCGQVSGLKTGMHSLRTLSDALQPNPPAMLSLEITWYVEAGPPGAGRLKQRCTAIWALRRRLRSSFTSQTRTAVWDSSSHCRTAVPSSGIIPCQGQLIAAALNNGTASKHGRVARRFDATIGDRIVKTKTKRKSEAVAEYITAIQQGHTAVIAKQVSIEHSASISKH